MSLIGSLDNKSSAASMNPASNSNVTKINSDDLSPKSSVQGNKKERTAGGSSSATLTSIPPPYTQEITMFGNKLQYLVRPRCGIKTQRKAKTTPPPTVLTLEDEGFMNEGIYGSVKCTVATGKTTTNSSNAEKQHLCGNHHGWKDVAGRSSAAAVSVMEHMLDHGCKREECRKDYGSV
ncbi:hypothetical protein L3X38_023299 [Prunus dulcis]|uniref:Uncharacterized protein n=1 Tax=Prunus dulcis TaxID=3755 RepID=A0AAD4VZ82_PRUDU|nr:hypothetical protein L3X38_023299 [Prunus dulcis]